MPKLKYNPYTATKLFRQADASIALVERMDVFMATFGSPALPQSQVMREKGRVVLQNAFRVQEEFLTMMDTIPEA